MGGYLDRKASGRGKTGAEVGMCSLGLKGGSCGWRGEGGSRWHEAGCRGREMMED